MMTGRGLFLLTVLSICFGGIYGQNCSLFTPSTLVSNSSSGEITTKGLFALNDRCTLQLTTPSYTDVLLKITLTYLVVYKGRPSNGYLLMPNGEKQRKKVLSLPSNPARCFLYTKNPTPSSCSNNIAASPGCGHHSDSNWPLRFTYFESLGIPNVSGVNAVYEFIDCTSPIPTTTVSTTTSTTGTTTSTTGTTTSTTGTTTSTTTTRTTASTTSTTTTRATTVPKTTSKAGPITTTGQTINGTHEQGCSLFNPSTRNLTSLSGEITTKGLFNPNDACRWQLTTPIYTDVLLKVTLTYLLVTEGTNCGNRGSLEMPNGEAQCENVFNLPSNPAKCFLYTKNSTPPSCTDNIAASSGCTHYNNGVWPLKFTYIEKRGIPGFSGFNLQYEFIDCTVRTEAPTTTAIANVPEFQKAIVVPSVVAAFAVLGFLIFLAGYYKRKNAKPGHSTLRNGKRKIPLPSVPYQLEGIYEGDSVHQYEDIKEAAHYEEPIPSSAEKGYYEEPIPVRAEKGRNGEPIPLSENPYLTPIENEYEPVIIQQSKP